MSNCCEHCKRVAPVASRYSQLATLSSALTTCLSGSRSLPHQTHSTGKNHFRDAEHGGDCTGSEVGTDVGLAL